jgi:predicted nucleic acid-binding protein
VILVDAAPLVALCEPRDALNRIALRDLTRAAGQPLVLCGVVLTEVCALLPYPMQRRRLRRLIDDFSVGAYPADDEPRLWRDVFAWLDRYAEHEPDWVDGYLAVVSARERQARIWTYDREFRTIWRRPDGSRIPVLGG